MITRIKKHPRISAMILMLIVAIPLMLSPIGALPLNPISDERIIVMDGLFSYDSELTFDVFNELGEEGRTTYFVFHIFDCVFALTYCIVMMTMLKPLCSPKIRWLGVALPMLPALFDLSENILIEIISSRFPDINHGLVGATSIISSMKWCAVILWFAAFIFLLIKKRFAKARS